MSTLTELYLSKVLIVEKIEQDSDKLKQDVVVYLKPEQIGSPDGCHCGICTFFDNERGECLLTKPAKCNAEKGVCSLFLGRGKADKVVPQGDTESFELIPKAQVGYIETAPTKCENCIAYSGTGTTGTCKGVGGTIYRDGCCNSWTAKS